MSSNLRRTVWNSRERILSTDQNSSAAHIHRNITESLRYQAMAQGLGEVSSLESGVIAGMAASVTGADLNVTISPGLAVKKGAGGGASEDSDFAWLEVLANEVIDLTSSVDGVNPRWVAIEIDTLAAGDSVETSTSRDIFDPSTGTFSSANVDKVRAPDPTFVVNAGTAAATPVLPQGAADRLPLCYVRLAAAAASIATTELVLCRPMLVPEANSLDEEDSVVGGGIDVDSSGDVLEVLPFHAKLRDWPVALSSAIKSHDLSALADNFETGDVYPPASGAPIYVYAVTPPYPTGYDADTADREMVVLAGNPLSTAFGTNCVIAFSTSTAPNVDEIGGDALAGQTLVGSVWGVTGTVGRSVYVGAIPYVADATNSLIAQHNSGAGRCNLSRPLELSETNVENNSDSGIVTGNLRRVNPLTPSGDTVLPATSSEFRVVVNYECDAGLGDVIIYDDYDTTDTTSVWEQIRNGLTLFSRRSQVTIVAANGTFRWRSVETFTVDVTFILNTIGYTDRILARR